MARLLCLAFASSFAMGAPTAQAAGQVTIRGLFDGARKALAGPAAEAPAGASAPAPTPTIPGGQDEEQAAFQRALQAYTVTVKDLAATKNLAVHQALVRGDNWFCRRD